MQRERFWIDSSGGGASRVRDRNMILPEIILYNAVDAQYICQALNFFHRTKTARHENAA